MERDSKREDSLPHHADRHSAGTGRYWSNPTPDHGSRGAPFGRDTQCEALRAVACVLIMGSTGDWTSAGTETPRQSGMTTAAFPLPPTPLRNGPEPARRDGSIAKRGVVGTDSAPACRECFRSTRQAPSLQGESPPPVHPGWRRSLGVVDRHGAGIGVDASLVTDPGHGSIERRSAGQPAIRAAASYRVAALAGSSPSPDPSRRVLRRRGGGRRRPGREPGQRLPHGALRFDLQAEVGGRALRPLIQDGPVGRHVRRGDRGGRGVASGIDVIEPRTRK